MQILYSLLKIWVTSFILFIFISFIIPSKRPFADGEVYINSNIYKESIVTVKPHLVVQHIDSCKEVLIKVDDWKHKSHDIKKIVFIIPRYEAIIYYFYLKQQNIIHEESYQISTIGEVFDIKRIFLKYQETIGVVFEYCLEWIIQQKNKIFDKITKSSK